MSISYWIEALITLSLPLAVLSWLTFDWMFGDGRLARDADRKEIKAKLKELKKEHKAGGAIKGHFIYRKWMWFGGGFYGLAALWTFVVIESRELIGFLLNFTSPGYFADLPSLAVNFLVSQLGNLLSAALWFAYWANDNGSIVVWALLAYLGYWYGIRMARRFTVAAQQQRLLEYSNALKLKWSGAARQATTASDNDESDVSKGE